MELKHGEDNLTRRYLLGDLSEAEKQQVEDRFFKDDHYYESLLVAEDELIYNYLCDALSRRERELFETQLAASERRREKVAVVKALMSEAATAARAEAPAVGTRAPTQAGARAKGASWWQALARFFAGRTLALQFALAAAMVLMAVAGVWLWAQTGNLRSRVEIAEAKRDESLQEAREARDRLQAAQQQAQAEQTRNQALNEQLQRAEQARQVAEKERAELEQRLQEESLKHSVNPAPADATVSFALESGIRRDESDEPQRLRLPPTARHIQLQLDLGSDDGKGVYRAEVKTFGGVLVWSKDALSATSTTWGKAVNLVLPAMVFKNGEYELTLKRARGQGKFEDAGYYYFKTEKP